MLAFVLLLLQSAQAQLYGRDFWPNDLSVVSSTRVGSNSLMDAIVEGNTVWVLTSDNVNFYIQAYDTTSGALTGNPKTILTSNTSNINSLEHEGINSGNLGRCASMNAVNEPLTRDGALYRAPHIGLYPSTVVITGSGGSCPGVRATPGTYNAGYKDGSVYTYDGFGLANRGSCTNFTATYTYTNCAYTGLDAFHCPMSVDPDGDSGVEYGACRFMLMYEGVKANSGGVPHSRTLLLANAQSLTSVWVRYLPSGASYPTATDARLSNTADHDIWGANQYSFVSVPTLYYDSRAALWRMWFVSEDEGRPAIRYSESPDDGQSWGVGTYGDHRDCWDGANFDGTACTEIAWVGTPPPDDPGSVRTPDIVDPEVYPINIDTDPAAELAMMFTGTDRSCSVPSGRVQLFQFHQDRGDQLISDWSWMQSTYMDAYDGVVLSNNRCPPAGSMMDAEIVRYATGKFIMFNNTRGGYYVSGSGFACSNFIDDDGDGRVDFGPDGGCASPTDDSE